ncbi:MAG: hypothetical protein K0U12_01255 [Gammaproteobacteria bacterium]|nr:hypothetical protein [Gammaproteobacteria bacterium]
MQNKKFISLVFIAASLFSVSALASPSSLPATKVAVNITRTAGTQMSLAGPISNGGGVYTLPTSRYKLVPAGTYTDKITAYVPQSGGSFRYTYSTDTCCQGSMTVTILPNAKQVTVVGTASENTGGACAGRTNPRTDCFPPSSSSYSPSYSGNNDDATATIAFQNNYKLPN